MEPRSSERRSVPVGLIAAAVILVLVLVFALQNSESTTITFLFFEREVSLILVIVGAAVLGMVAGALLRYQRSRRQRT